jgi:hypothetical protein
MEAMKRSAVAVIIFGRIGRIGVSSYYNMN